jgi:pimeloyl-ACP methyl ester carboxylesterase
MGFTTKTMLTRRLRSGAVGTEAWSKPRLASVWEQFDQGTQRALLRLHRRVDEGRLGELGSDLGALEQPALIVWGERDPWFPIDFARAYAARLPNAEVRRIADAGHWPWLDQPGTIEIVAEFLGKALP